MSRIESLEVFMKLLRFICKALVMAAVVAGVVGCGGGTNTLGGTSGTTTGGTTTTTTTAGSINIGAATSVYVIQQLSNSAGTILEFPATASGSVAPVATIAPGLVLGQVATDQLGDIYVATSTDIREYASGTIGSPTPIRMIPSGTVTGLYDIDGLAVSPTGAIVVGQDGGDIDEWSATQNGSVAPTRRIPGYSQGGMSPVIVANQVAVDTSDNIYVAAEGGPPIPNKVTIFGPSTNGNAAPTRTVGGTGISSGVTTDSAGNIYTANEVLCTLTGVNETCQGIVSEYAANAAATDPPIRTISGSATMLATLYGIKVDAVGNIFVISATFNPPGSSTTINPTVLKFAAGATGNVAPTSSFTSSAWTTPDFNPSLALH
jgi:hypothetical protein